MEKKVPLRKCCGCGQAKGKKELLRILRTTDQKVILDESGRANGRGAYLCRDIQCLEKAVRSHSLERSLKCPVSQDVFDLLKKEMSDLG